MSIKRDKKTVKVITILSGILFFGLVMGIVIFSLPDTKRGKTDKDESVAEAESTTAHIKEETAAPETEKDTEPQTEPPKEPPTEKETEPEPTEPETEEEAISIDLIAFGDNLLHKGIFDWNMMLNGDYRITSAYENIKDMVASADIAVVNQETVIGGIDLGLHDYPRFNAPYDAADVLHELGFDVVTTANNHIYDMGVQGIINQIDYFTNNYPDILLTGTYKTAEERAQIPIFEAKGIKVAFLNYTYGHNRFEKGDVIVNMLDTDQVTADIVRAKEAADFVCVCVHWGEENKKVENEQQQALAQLMSDYGADLIIGTHPHVVQNVTVLTGKDGNSTLCYYSLGNLVSLQHTTPTMLGGVAKVTFTKVGDAKAITAFDYDFVVTQWDAMHGGCRVIPWKDYTPELAAEHGMPSFDKTFSYDTLAAIVEKYRLK